MMSDYEVKILREMRKGESDPERISGRTGIPLEIVEVVVREHRHDFKEPETRKKIRFTKDSVTLLIDLIILYVLLRLVMALAG